MKRARPRLTYANVVSTLALFLVLTGGVAYGAKKLGTNRIKPRAIKTKLLAPRAVKSGKIAPRAVKRRHLALNAVGNGQIAADSIDGAKVRDGSLTPADILGGAAVRTTASGGGFDVTATEFGEAQTVALGGAVWTQGAQENNLFVARIEATLKSKPMSTCILESVIDLDGRPLGGGSATTSSTETVSVTREFNLEGATTATGVPRPHQLGARVYSAGNGCETIRLDSLQIVVLGIG
ncbi:MAG TPA: hypothetical protein VFZ41_06885 [Solirubrobacterales bacterium]